MKTKIRGSKSLKETLRLMASYMVLDSGTRYHFLPYVFEESDGKWFAYHLEDLPPDVKSNIELIRNSISETRMDTKERRPLTPDDCINPNT